MGFFQARVLEWGAIAFSKVSLNRSQIQMEYEGSPGGLDGKQLACNAGDLGLTPGWKRSPAEGNGYHSSILDWRIPWTQENSIDRIPVID